ncbi:MAG: SWIM zinc finger family protein, partial [Chitinophagaceae bacterium]
MHFSEEQIWVLAPDEASKKAGKDLSIPQKWVTKGSNNQVIWGECLGSGSKPYQTQIHIESVTFKCSCPSRKFPCKHSIGLLLLHAKNNILFTETTQPDWVTDWLAKKNEQSVKKTVDKEKVIDEVAQSKRLQAREQLVENGLNDVLLWMKDWV